MYCILKETYFDATLECNEGMFNSCNLYEMLGDSVLVGQLLFMFVVMASQNMQSLCGSRALTSSFNLVIGSSSIDAGRL